MIEFTRVFSTPQVNPYDTVTWEKTDIKIVAEDGHIVYECTGAEFPATWSEDARRITASKYFRAARDNSEYVETSARQMIERVVSGITNSGIAQGYFDTSNADVFADELRMLLLHQMASFNSPVWFNLGVPGNDKFQVSACFINEVEDTMDSILELARVEGMIFKEGSGSGVNYSKLRGSNERIRGGGHASGPTSFMAGYDAFANVILSGGRTRRSARMSILNIDHPDIEKFINLKVEQEGIVESLVKAGYSTDFTAPNNAYNLVKHQSSNNSVRVSDEFLTKARAILYGYEPDADWELKNRADHSPNQKVSHRKLFRMIAEAAWRCGDPGIQFDNIINRMNTCANTGYISCSNPCSEFMFVDNSACNLSSLNLGRFVKDDNTFNTKVFRSAVRLMITAQDILVNLGDYPTEKIKNNSRALRPLGLGYSNLGGLLMSWGIPYDSDLGRSWAAAITNVMTAQAYLTSTELAETKGAFEEFERNKSCMESVLDIHCNSSRALELTLPENLPKASTIWQEVMSKGFGRRKKQEEVHGFRNSQVTLLAPTGTISWLMDCATTGIEPDIALRKTKLLVGGNRMTYVNPNVGKALKTLGYDEKEQKRLLEYVDKHGHFEDSNLNPEHLPVFDCALPINNRNISTEGHIKMMAAVQPFLSGAISKTVNMPNEATIDDVERLYIRAWELGLKSLAIYRAGSKLSEPMRVKELKVQTEALDTPKRIKLPDDLEQAPRHKFSIQGHTGYLHVGLHPKTHRPAEIFVRMASFGSTVGGLLDSFAIVVSKALQYGIPLEEILSNMIGSKFPPAGWTTNPDIRSAGSILDYLGRYLKQKYCNGDSGEITKLQTHSIIPEEYDETDDIDGEPCPECGALLRKAGACSTCTNCAYSSGVCG